MNLTPITTGGLNAAYGEIWAYEVSTTIAIAALGIANKVQITVFDHNGFAKDTTPDHTNDHITINKDGLYAIHVSLAMKSVVAGGADNIGFGVFKNNGTVQLPNLHAKRTLTGGGIDSGNVSLSGIANFDNTDTVEVWLWNYDSADDVLIDDINLTVFQIAKQADAVPITGNPIGLLLSLTYS